MYTAIFSAALAGLVLSAYIWRKHSTGQKLVCVIGQDCNAVIGSQYNKLIFGISNEVLGMAYYAVVAVAIIALWLGVTSIASISLMLLLVIAGGIGALFSVFLTGVQLIALQEWCEYCLTSAGLSILIFILELIIIL